MKTPIIRRFLAALALLVGGIAPGTTVWVRVRTCGTGGVMGAWSDPAKIVVV